MLAIKNLVVWSVSVDDLRDDVGYDDDGWARLDLWLPKNHRPFSFALTLRIGPRDDKGAELFHLWIQTREPGEKKDTDRKRKYTLYVYHFDWPKIKALVTNRVLSCAADSKDESLELLRQKFFWEYEKTPTPKSRRKLR